MENLMEKITSLCKRRGFIFPGSEIYGGLANSWDYGPLGVELKNNIKQLWWQRFVQSREDIVGVDTALIMSPKVWEASGHTGAGFADPLRECQKCHHRFRADLLEKNQCPDCAGPLAEERKFNILMKTFLGSVEDAAGLAYLRGETAQGMFVNFKNVLNTTRLALPFGIAQIGKSFRNEITPGNFIFRTREFEQMEIEYFIAPPQKDEDWQQWFDYWRLAMRTWMQEIGLDLDQVHEREVPDSERAHYSKKTIDFDYDFPFGQKELYGLAYRTDFDLKNHEKFSGQNLKYRDPDAGGKEFWPHVIEPTWGVDRSVLAILCAAYCEDKERIVLKIVPRLAPYKVAIFPLLANKPDLVKTARSVFDQLRPIFQVAWDDRGNIGKRYYAQDEIGTPFCLTIDFQTLEDETVTIRDRDTARQERVKISGLVETIKNKLQ
jgi:glycyl-tRNA synthetase